MPATAFYKASACDLHHSACAQPRLQHVLAAFGCCAIIAGRHQVCWLQILQQHGVLPGQEHLWQFVLDAINVKAVTNAGPPRLPAKKKAQSDDETEEELLSQQRMWWRLDHGPANREIQHKGAGRQKTCKTM